MFYPYFHEDSLFRSYKWSHRYLHPKFLHSNIYPFLKTGIAVSLYFRDSFKMVCNFSILSLLQSQQSVTECNKIICRVSQKSVISPLKINIFQKFKYQNNLETVAVLLVVECSKIIVFRRRYGALIWNYTEITSLFPPWHWLLVPVY